MAYSSIVENPIMLGGCGSSGTSLLSYLLNLHSSLYCGPEMSILSKKSLYDEPQFKHQKSNIVKALNHSHKKPQSEKPPIFTTGVLNNSLLGESTYSNKMRKINFIYKPERYGFSQDDWIQIIQRSQSLKEAIDSCFQIILSKYRKKRWAEKTPTNCYCIAEFFATYPSGVYVHVLRDGRDVVASLIKRGLKPENAVRRWLHDTSTVLPFVGMSHCYLIKYEELVLEPKATLNRLFSYLNEHQEADRVLELQGTKPVANQHDSWKLKTTDPISTKSLGKWRLADYPDKPYIEQLFQRTRLSTAVQHSLNLDTSINANELLEIFNYDSHDTWNRDPRLDHRFVLHALLEKTLHLFSLEKTYCEVSL